MHKLSIGVSCIDGLKAILEQKCTAYVLMVIRVLKTLLFKRPWPRFISLLARTRVSRCILYLTWFYVSVKPALIIP